MTQLIFYLEIGELIMSKNGHETIVLKKILKFILVFLLCSQTEHRKHKKEKACSLHICPYFIVSTFNRTTPLKRTNLSYIYLPFFAIYQPLTHPQKGKFYSQHLFSFIILSSKKFVKVFVQNGLSTKKVSRLH